jgi:NAD(P)-dependent dehydrogenase (short-subunit alcohol dehydrogenase family)
MDIQTLFNLNGRVALVTGGSRGIGKMIVEGYLKAGAARVYISARKVDQIEETVAEFGNQVIGLPCDLSTVDGCLSLAEQIAAREEKVDILVNNAGAAWGADFGQFPESGWDRVMDLNVKSAFLTMKSVLPIMESQGSGSIISISSVAGLRYVGKPQVAYAAGKAALMQLTKTTAVIYAAKGIRLNCVVPGLVFTPLVKRLADKYAGGQFEAFVEHRHQQVPAGHMGDAWDVAHAVLFLASDESRYITAQSIVVDGGLIAATR